MHILIDQNRCDGCGTCVGNCPKHVLELRKISQADYDRLSFIGKMKVGLRGDRKSFAINEPACADCGKCQKNCRDRAIKVVR